MLFGSVIVSKEGESHALNQSITSTPLLIWMSSRGRIIKQISFGKAFDRASSVPNGMVATGPPGTFFLGTNSEIYEYGEEGGVIKVLPLNAPANHSIITAIQYVDGRIALVFSYPVSEVGRSLKSDDNAEPYFGSLAQAWFIENVTTGEAEAFYEAPDAFKGTALCYQGGRSFLFTTVKAGQPYIIQMNE